MPAVPADLSVSCRWILPMTARAAVLENHTVVVRDGRILDVLPHSVAAQSYAATVHLQRSAHVLLPGLVNARTRLVQRADVGASPDLMRDAALLGIAALLRAGTTCICDTGYFPQLSARAATEQGVRAVIGIPISASSSPWVRDPRDYLTRALGFRDEYRGHPTIATAFAPHRLSAISDVTLSRVSVLAAELDAGVLISLHASLDEISESLARHGSRPIERMHALGLLTPSLTAAHLVHVDASDIELARRSGIAVTLCPEATLRAGHGFAPVAPWAETDLRLSLGTGTAPDAGFDLWAAVRQLGLLSPSPGSAAAWDALAIATRGGAAALGLDAEIGTLEPGKWADLCCVDLGSPAMLRAMHGEAAHAPVLPLVFNATRDLVSDVWISGHHLLNDAAFTRLDWPALTARTSASATRPTT